MISTVISKINTFKQPEATAIHDLVSDNQPGYRSTLETQGSRLASAGRDDALARFTYDFLKNQGYQFK